MKKLMLIYLGIFICGANLLAQQGSDDPVARAFFAPELVMQNQQAINLTENQRNTITKELQNAQSEFTGWQWDLQKEMEKFKVLIEKENPNEGDIVEQLERMLSLENKIKKRQITLLVRIKNVLNREQQEKLQRLKK
jgi:Spy/CpxP family protein refolding chaperone